MCGVYSAVGGESGVRGWRMLEAVPSVLGSMIVPVRIYGILPIDEN